MRQENNIDTTHRDYLPAVWIVLLLGPYLKRNQFIFIKDHHALPWVANQAHATGKTAHSLPKLLYYDFEILHNAGVKYQAVDALSILTPVRVDSTERENKILVMVVAEMKRPNNKKRSIVPNWTKKKE